MPVVNACFISYRHRPVKDYETWIDDLHRELGNEILLHLSDEGVYLDKLRLEGGDFYNDDLARALCESVCLIMVYIRTYFDSKYPYCAREYKAMEKLEAERLEKLGNIGVRQHGIIIPIVCRDWEHFPAEIKSKRQCYNFETYLMEKPRISKHPKALGEIKKIGKYVADRYWELKSLPEDACAPCATFVLPTEEEVKPWLTQVTAVCLGFPRP